MQLHKKGLSRVADGSFQRSLCAQSVGFRLDRRKAELPLPLRRGSHADGPAGSWSSPVPLGTIPDTQRVAGPFFGSCFGGRVPSKSSNKRRLSFISMASGNE